MSNIVFNEENHTYTLDGRQLISVTQLLKKHELAPDYSMVERELLERKSERGRMIHAEIEEFLKCKTIGISTELYDFIDLAKDIELDLSNAVSESIVHNDLIAGTVDFQGVKKNGKTVLADFKTGASINKEACRWQLSLYERLIGEKFDEMYIFHLGEKSKVILIDRIASEEIDSLIACERSNQIYSKRELSVSDTLLAETQNAELVIKRIKSELAFAESVAENLKSEMMTEMFKQGIKSYESPLMKITYIEATTKETIDSTKLRKERPDLAKQYTKISNVKESIRITLRS